MLTGRFKDQQGVETELRRIHRLNEAVGGGVGDSSGVDIGGGRGGGEGGGGGGRVVSIWQRR